MHTLGECVDYILSNLKRGLKTANSLGKALEELGIESDSMGATAQQKYIKIMNDKVSELAEQRGFQVVHPIRDASVKEKIRHLTNEELMLREKNEQLEKKLAEAMTLPLGKVMVSKGRLEQLEQTEALYKEKLPLIDKSERELKAVKNSVEAYNKSLQQLLTDKKNFNAKVNEEALKKLKYSKSLTGKFITSSPQIMNAFIEFTKQAEAQAELEQQSQHI